MKETPLADAHKKLGATMVPFAGWNMPVQYTTVIDEHNATRSSAGLFDICHMGECIVEGSEAKKLIASLIVGDIDKVSSGKAMYSLMCEENGTVIDDLFIYRINENKYMLVLNACNTEKDVEWVQKHAPNFDVKVTDITDETGKLDLQGPNAIPILKKLTDAEIPSRFHFVEADVAGIKTTISRTGYTAEDGVELYYPIEKSEEMWNALMEAGEEFKLKPVGLGARDTLRIEACYSLYGHEINDKISPVQAGLSWAVQNKSDFVGKDVLQKQKEEGTKQKLVAFEMKTRGIPRENYEVLVNDVVIGHVTSGTFSPTFKKPIGLALINKEDGKIGNELSIKIRDKLYDAVIVKRPFYEYKGGS